MEILFEIIVMVIIFFSVNYGGYWITEVRGLPSWLQYKPFICRLCLTFWSLMGVYIALGLSFSCLYLMIGGCILAIFNALAMWIDQRNKTIKVDDNGFQIYDVDGDTYEIRPRNKKYDYELDK